MSAYNLNDALYFGKDNASYGDGEALSGAELRRLGKTAADKYISAGAPLTDSVISLCKEASLNNDQARRVVEAANTATFQALHTTKLAKGNIEYTLADPDKVLAAMAAASDTPNRLSTKVASVVEGYSRAKLRSAPADDVVSVFFEKTANVEDPDFCPHSTAAVEARSSAAALDRQDAGLRRLRQRESELEAQLFAATNDVLKCAAAHVASGGRVIDIYTQLKRDGVSTAVARSITKLASAPLPPDMGPPPGMMGPGPQPPPGMPPQGPPMPPPGMAPPGMPPPGPQGMQPMPPPLVHTLSTVVGQLIDVQALINQSLAGNKSLLEFLSGASPDDPDGASALFAPPPPMLPPPPGMAPPGMMPPGPMAGPPPGGPAQGPIGPKAPPPQPGGAQGGPEPIPSAQVPANPQVGQ